MNIAEIIKKQGFFEKLVQKKQNGTLANAMLFFCEDDLTSRMTMILTSLLLEYEMFELFNEKSAEYVKIQNNVDLDVKLFPKNGEKFLTSDSNEIVSEAFVKPVNLPNKVFIVQNIDVSTDEAQNKLLKILEEPPKNVFFLLSAKSEEKVLPTIKSRCDKIRIEPFAKEDIEKNCSDKLAIILGQGYIGKTLELEKNDQLQACVDFAVSLFTEMKNSKQVLLFSKRFQELKDDLQLVLQTVLLCIEDLLKLKCESENICKLVPYLENLKFVEPEFSVRALCEISKLVTNLTEKMEFNANLPVAIDGFLLKILEVKYLCK